MLLLDWHLLEFQAVCFGIQQLQQPALGSNLSREFLQWSTPTRSHQNYTHHTCTQTLIIALQTLTSYLNGANRYGLNLLLIGWLISQDFWCHPLRLQAKDIFSVFGKYYISRNETNSGDKLIIISMMNSITNYRSSTRLWWQKCMVLHSWQTKITNLWKDKQERNNNIYTFNRCKKTT